MSWDFDSGHLALDFVNTLQWRGRQPPEELLNSEADVIEWARDGGLLSSEQDDGQILDRSPGIPAPKSSLGEIKAFRERLYQIFSKITAGSPPSEEDLDILHQMFSSRIPKARLIWDGGHLSWIWHDDGDVLDRILWLIAQEALDLLMGDKLDRVGECADDRGCGYLFIDTTRNRSRRWCSMESCGNRAKARKHYQRRRVDKLEEKEVG